MASGDTLAVFFAEHGTPPTTTFATLDTRAGPNGARQTVLDFDATLNERMEFNGFMPRHYGGSLGVTVTIGWMATTATSGNCQWEVAFKSVTDDADDLVNKTYPTAATVIDVPANVIGEVAYTTLNIGNDDTAFNGVLAGEFYRLRIARGVPASNMSDDAELVFIEISEQ
jgi:hypothetical protein